MDDLTCNTQVPPPPIRSGPSTLREQRRRAEEEEDDDIGLVSDRGRHYRTTTPSKGAALSQREEFRPRGAAGPSMQLPWMDVYSQQQMQRQQQMQHQQQWMQQVITLGMPKQ